MDDGGLWWRGEPWGRTAGAGLGAAGDFFVAGSRGVGKEVLMTSYSAVVTSCWWGMKRDCCCNFHAWISVDILVIYTGSKNIFIYIAK